MLGAGILGGVGLHHGHLRGEPSPSQAELIYDAQIGILSASLRAGVIGFLFLFMQGLGPPSARASRGVSSPRWMRWWPNGRGRGRHS